MLIHVITKKGKGYRNAEKDPGKFHGIGKFDPETGKVLASAGKPTYSKVMGDYLTELAEKDSRIVAITAAMGDATGLGRLCREVSGAILRCRDCRAACGDICRGACQGGHAAVCLYLLFVFTACL